MIAIPPKRIGKVIRLSCPVEWYDIREDGRIIPIVPSTFTLSNAVRFGTEEEAERWIEKHREFIRWGNPRAINANKLSTMRTKPYDSEPLPFLVLWTEIQ